MYFTQNNTEKFYNILIKNEVTQFLKFSMLGTGGNMLAGSEFHSQDILGM